MSSFTITPIPDDREPGWTINDLKLEIVDGVPAVRRLVLKSRFGKLEYGLRPEGYDAWVFSEAGGGGAVTMPFVRLEDGEILVGLVLEKRANMGEEPVWCAIGGFLDPGETHTEAQVREVAEEAAIDAMKAQELKGLPANSNRLFFVADPQQGEGIHVYGLEVPSSMLEQKDDLLRLKPEAHLPGYKKEGDVRFFPWREAIAKTADVIARGAIAQLLAKAL